MSAGSSAAATAQGGVIEGGFACSVSGVDGTRGGFEAARQAARLTSPQGRLVMVGVAEMFDALAGKWGPEPGRRRLEIPGEHTMEECAEALRSRARESLAWAEAQVAAPGELSSRVVDGQVHEGLLWAAREEDAGLIAVGAHGGPRLVEAFLAESAAMVLHDAPVSVLVARQSFDPGRFPAHIVVGVDGSAEARAALETAAILRERSSGRLTVVTAGRDQEEAVASLDGFDAPHDHIAVPDRPVEALVAAARTADLTVLGSRGLHGRRALGSVSERVAFRADSSVLVVRPART